MFSQSKPGSVFSLGGSPSGFASNDKAKAKPLTPAEKYEQALVTANVFLDDSRARMTKSLDRYNAVANSTYWFYGYFGGNAMTTMAACLALGNRWAFFSSYSGWIALAGGYAGGKACLGLHLGYLMSGVQQQLDHEITEATRMDEQTSHIVPDYMREAERLRQIKCEMMPTLPEAAAARSHQAEQTLDDRVDALVEAYMKRREALEKK